ncbi:hypothetical protein BK120_15830 [Paenibacillus sp. FSL A5-0031]|nr:hypothetical protein BK120_15830 [Paenibacillus sp. FSL A5-0031]
MKLQVLVSTMHQNDFSIIDKMNLKSNTIIINQCSRNEYSEYEDENMQVKMYSFNERGIGLSRNNALMRSNADICLLADDDVIYNDGYGTLIIEAFENNPNADIIMFNVPSLNMNRVGSLNNKKEHRVNYTNFMRYGAVRIAFRRESVIKANVYFSLLFGGGAKYSSGEDTLFINDCLKKGLKIYTSASQIGIVKQESSTWFNGYNKKYFFDKGVFFKLLSNKWSIFLIIQFAIRKYSLYKNDTGLKEAIKYMLDGRRSIITKAD